MSTSKPNHISDFLDSIPFQQVSKTLNELCQQQSPCSLEFIQSRSVIQLTMTNLHDDCLELRTPVKDKLAERLTESICCVSFSNGSFFFAFLSYLIDVNDTNNGESQFFLTIPTNISASNIRKTFRVPVMSESGLVTIMRTPAKQELVVCTTNLSDAGIEVDFGADERLDVREGIKVEIELRYKDKTAHKTAEICRMTENKCGLRFTRFAGDDPHHDEIHLKSIFSELRRLWLKNRANSESE